MTLEEISYSSLLFMWFVTGVWGFISLIISGGPSFVGKNKQAADFFQGVLAAVSLIFFGWIVVNWILVTVISH